MAPSANMGEPYLVPGHPPIDDNHQFPRSFTAASGISLFLVLYMIDLISDRFKISNLYVNPMQICHV